MRKNHILKVNSELIKLIDQFFNIHRGEKYISISRFLFAVSNLCRKNVEQEII